MVEILKTSLGIAADGLDMGLSVSSDADFGPSWGNDKLPNARLQRWITKGDPAAIEIRETKLAASTTAQFKLRRLDIRQAILAAAFLRVSWHRRAMNTREATWFQQRALSFATAFFGLDVRERRDSGFELGIWPS
jgi:hypothetical protein